MPGVKTSPKVLAPRSRSKDPEKFIVSSVPKSRGEVSKLPTVKRSKVPEDEKSMKSISDTFEAFRDGRTPEYICQNCGAATTQGMLGSWSLSKECKNMGKQACVPVKNPKFKGDKY